MGDRANIYVKNHNGGVYLYTHWGGYNLAITLKKALSKKWRWNDGPYLTRIIFDTMSEGHQGEETSFGISTDMPDNEYMILVVDPEAQEVTTVNEHSARAASFDCPHKRATFEEFIAMSDESVRAFHQETA